MPTLIVPPAEFDLESVVVSGDEYRHLFRALRLKTGDALRVVDGEGNARAGTIDSVGRDGATVVLGEPEPSRELARRVELAVAQLRPERARWLVEKATELGVSEIVWFECQRSQQKWPDRLFGRLERVARSAVEQSGRARLPRVDRVVCWSGLMEQISGGQLLAGPLVAEGEVVLSETLLAHPCEDEAEPPFQTVDQLPRGDCRIVVGPEGGFTEVEVEEAVAAGARRVGLGERILRVETAAVAMLSIVVGSGAIEGGLD